MTRDMAGRSKNRLLIADRLLASLPDDLRGRFAKSDDWTLTPKYGDPPDWVVFKWDDGIDYRGGTGWSWEVRLEICGDGEVECAVTSRRMGAAAVTDAMFSTIHGGDLEGLPGFFLDVAVAAMRGEYGREF